MSDEESLIRVRRNDPTPTLKEGEGMVFSIPFEVAEYIIIHNLPERFGETVIIHLGTKKGKKHYSIDFPPMGVVISFTLERKSKRQTILGYTRPGWHHPIPNVDLFTEKLEYYKKQDPDDPRNADLEAAYTEILNQNRGIYYIREQLAKGFMGMISWMFYLFSQNEESKLPWDVIQRFELHYKRKRLGIPDPLEKVADDLGVGIDRVNQLHREYKKIFVD